MMFTGTGRHRAPRPQTTRRVVTTTTAGIAIPLLGATAANAAESHTVKPGESLSRIAESQGLPGGWQELYKSNRSVVGSNPNMIVPGQRLTVDPSGKPAGKAESAPAQRKQGAQSEQKSDARSGTAVVGRGDTLASIAEEHDMRGGWPRLYRDNRSAVGGDPDRLSVGTRLKVDAEAGPVAAPASAPARTTAGKDAGAEHRAERAPQRSTREQARRPSAAPRSNTPRTTSGGYSMPVSGFSLSASFGSGGGRWSHGHTGQDFAVPSGTSVKAVTAGTVVKAGWGGAYGYEVVIKHAPGVFTQYAHLSSLNVSAGSRVGGGQQIARSGSTGNSTGPHLHFEVRTTPDYGSAISPLNWLRNHGLRV
jgi:murein DD-endopeptidase MepM/ murein hydrolase activator NlpD